MSLSSSETETIFSNDRELRSKDNHMPFIWRIKIPVLKGNRMCNLNWTYRQVEDVSEITRRSHRPNQNGWSVSHEMMSWFY